MYHRSDPIFHPLLVCGHHFPSTWRYMLPQEFATLRLPEERIANCDACPMVAIEAYRPDCRCCTHWAQIPNFQLGLALKDLRTRDMVTQVIRDGDAIPEGMALTPAQTVRFHAAYQADLFGKSRNILCPFMNVNKGGCTIYPYRVAICSTHYCGHDHGEAGAAFWEDLGDLAGQVETRLSQWAMEKVGMSVLSYKERRNQLAERVETLARDGSKGWPADVRASLFGDWYGNEEGFFEACADQVMTHRDELWAIACQQPLLEFEAYDDAIEKRVLSDIDALDVDDEGAHEEMCAPMETHLETAWNTLLNASSRLWRLPPDGASLVLCDRVVIEDNDKCDLLSRFFGEMPYRLIIPGHGDDEESNTLFLSDAEHDAVLIFKRAQLFGPRLYQDKRLTAFDDPAATLAKWLRCGIIQSKASL